MSGSNMFREKTYHGTSKTEPRKQQHVQRNEARKIKWKMDISGD
jgi:hypothetical protein